jgi:hypothetical protein
MVIWLNGAFVEGDAARVSALDAGLQHGVGLFETMQARHGRVFRLADHLDRLAESAAELGLAEAAEEVVETDGGAARITAGLHPDAHFRGMAELNLGEDILVGSHGLVLLHDQIGRLSHQFHHSGQPRVHSGPLMMMQTALQKPALSASRRPRRWMPRVPIE